MSIPTTLVNASQAALANSTAQAAALSHSGSIKPNPQPANSPAALKLRQAANEFESILLSSLWKSMKGSFASEDDSSDPAHDTLDSLGVQSLCSAVGKAGGLGLGKLILKHLEPLQIRSKTGKSEGPG